MAAPTKYYVRYTNGTDSAGNGTSHAAAYKTIQYALDDIGTTHGRNSTDGDQVNICDEADQTITTTLSLATYGTPALAAPLILRGYTAVSEDGGFGVIDMQGNNNSIISGGSYIHFRDMRLIGTGTADVVSLGSDSSVFHCEVSGSTGDGIVFTSSRNSANQCYLTDIAGDGVQVLSGECSVRNSFFDGVQGANAFGAAIDLNTGSNCERNVIYVDAGSHGVDLRIQARASVVSHNSILSAGGSGSGIIGGSNALLSVIVDSNLIEGFTSGTGYDFTTITRDMHGFMNNGAYNNSTNYDLEVGDTINEEDKEVLGASPFAKSGSIPTDFTDADFWSDLFTYFAPVDTGGVRGGAWPNGSRLDKGAVQHADPAGGGGTNRPATQFGGIAFP